GNLPFGESGSTYEPPDEVKGDVARMVFYMDARYPSLNIAPSTIGDLGTLLQWHEEDPVDAFEENRNDVIYSYQNNRNPFIDHPHLALLMYHDHPDVTLD
ncbi:MAG: endonuclease, partial [bacterium]